MIILRLLGPPLVTIDGREAPADLLWRKHLALLLYLHAAGRRGAARATLLDLLWGDKPESAARHSLNEALRVLRRALGDGAVVTEGGQVTLDVEVDSDLQRVESALAAGDEAVAASLVRGEFAEGLEVPGAAPFGDWLLAMRTEWRRRGADLLAREAERRLARGDAAGAAQLADRALRLDPHAETAVEAAMRAWALLGDRAAALAAFDRHRSEQVAVGAPVAPRILRLADRVRAVRPAPDGATGARVAGSRRAPLVGRERDVSRLAETWATCATGRAAAALIRGDSGTGRSRLLDELAERARLGGATVLSLRAVRADRADPFGGLRALAGTRLLEAPGVAAAPAQALATLAASLSPWAERFPHAHGTSDLSLRQAVVEVLRATLGEAPLVLAVDDAQWLDEESLLALAALPRDLPDQPLLMAMTTLQAQVPPALDAIAAAIGRDLPGASVTLGPLTLEALAALVAASFPAYAPDAVERMARRVAVDSAGLPLLAVELVHAVAGGLELRDVTTPWPAPARTLDQTLPADLPDVVTSALRLGFRRLGEPARRALVALALLGEREPPGRLGQAAGLTATDLEAALDELEWQRWVHVDARGVLFVARIAREVVGRDFATPGQRARILARVEAP